MKSIFIDGEAGTTGLLIRQRLAQLPQLALQDMAPALRKDPKAKLELMAQADLVVLCLPDAAARESVAMIDTLPMPQPRIIDASTAHRTQAGWVYGFPELCVGQADAIGQAQRVSNPGCYASAAIAILRPLVEGGLLPPDFPLALSAVSGYTGGGKALIEAFQSPQAPSFEAYALDLQHKHIPEIMKHSGLTKRPLFVPSVGNFRQGMLLQLPLHLDALPGRPSAADIESVLRQHYERTRGGCVKVCSASSDNKLDATALNDTNLLEIRVFANTAEHHAVLLVRLDNLGKGASGAAVQNLRLMLGV